MRPNGVITLLTDFGLADFFVGAMKGVILSIHREAVIVDLTHLIPPQDIWTAALTLADSVGTFPEGTIHVAVVDPGVGSGRRAVLIETTRSFFIGPDNGLFTLVLEDDPPRRAIHITNDRFFRHPVSRTFHGRDIFAPVAAWLARGVEPSEFGPGIADVVRLPIPRVERLSETHWRGQVIHVDRFGNLITNITARDVPLEALRAGGRLLINGYEVSALRTHYQEAAEGEVFALIGSTGRVEISIRQGSAATVLGVGRGALVDVLLPGQGSHAPPRDR
ncbi:MAG: SAM-dependent chlorinase/fluorinase [Blastocatellia bacterium]|nr:SAM-dependent chlorinase/fluorinase [Blastocatellia bacterium]MCS7156673.1 SAM-dependent chlorinase/fluorinase [Blastocatellia bacterium]MCX7751585.1 SAM-dependent chlorinase/fluorinase [Blastocatellia bacterium]MDW8168685.1 SAM-dependent chlorinase/fluorinase [Acidobacteriota bacterium]MDW8255848.1 SAM-dependent chlorinase/fluorinase [Acidobacteriota bacterium]